MSHPGEAREPERRETKAPWKWSGGPTILNSGIAKTFAFAVERVRAGAEESRRGRILPFHVGAERIRSLVMVLPLRQPVLFVSLWLFG